MLFLLYVGAALAFGSLAGEFGEAHAIGWSISCGFLSLVSFTFGIVCLIDYLPKGGPDDDSPTPA